MKKVVIFVFFLVIIKSFGQINKTNYITNKTNYITNKKNFEKSLFSKLKLTKETTIFSFDTLVFNFGLNKFDDVNQRISKITGLTDSCLTSALSFSLDNNSMDVYYLPINDKKFNYDYFREYIQRKTRPIQVKIFTTIYRTDSTPVILIDKIELLE